MDITLEFFIVVLKILQLLFQLINEILIAVSANTQEEEEEEEG